MNTLTIDVLVIGAGPTGLTMATMLARSGVTVRILDKKTGPTTESRAVVIHAKTLELFAKLDLAAQAVAEGQKIGGVDLLKAGKQMGEISFFTDKTDNRTPYPFALIYPQNETEHLLLHSLNELGVQVEWEKELLHLEQTPTGARATVRHANGTEEIIESAWVIGADGSHSPVRHALSLGFSGESYKQVLFLADVELDWALANDKVYIDLTRTSFLGFFPMSDEKRFRLLGALPPEIADKDELTLDEVRAIVNAQSGLPIAILDARWISVYRTHHRMTERFRVGRVFLVGDAAHIHSPAGGQGMNTGIGDAYNLAWKLALVVKGQAHESILDSYEAERMPFARAILHGSDRGFQLMSAPTPFTQDLKMLAVPLLARTASSLSPARKRLFWLVSQLWTNYRNSPVVSEPGSLKKGPHAGERAPYGFFEAGPHAGTDLFTQLTGLDHHLLLFPASGSSSNSPATHELEENLHTLLATYAIPIHLHTIPAGNPSLYKQYNVDEPALFLVRPDGHIAYRGPLTNVDDLRSYLDNLFEIREIHEPALLPLS